MLSKVARPPVEELGNTLNWKVVVPAPLVGDRGVTQALPDWRDQEHAAPVVRVTPKLPPEEGMLAEAEERL